MSGQLVELARRASSSAALAERLQDLSDDEHAALAQQWQQHHRDIQHDLFAVGALTRFAMLAGSFDTEPELLLAALTAKVWRSLARDAAALDHIAGAAASRGQQWCRQLLAAATRGQAEACRFWPLTSRVATAAELPQPDDLGSWLGRFRPPRSGKERALFDHIVADLATLTPGERRSAVTALKKALVSSAHEQWRDPLQGWAVPLMLEIGGTPAQVVRALTVRWSRIGSAPREHLTRQLLTRDDDTVGDFVAAALRSRGVAGQVMLLDPILEARQLPIPDSPAYLGSWLRSCPEPRPGIRWVERFVAACRVPNAFATDGGFPEWMRATFQKFRAAEPVDDDALVVALLGPLERGDRPGAQRSAWQWIVGLQLEAALTAHTDRVIEALSSTDGAVAKQLVTLLLEADTLSDDHLGRIALAVLPRTEQGLRRQVVKALRRLDVPSTDLQDLVTALAEDPDVTTAGLAADLLSRWGAAPAAGATAQAELLGLWRDPARTTPQPSPEFEPDHLVVDAVQWQELLAGLARWPKPIVPQEQAVAALVATAHARGFGALAELDQGGKHADPSPEALRRRLLHPLSTWEADKHHHPDQLSRLLHRRTGELGAHLGQVPCMLSAPSHTRLRISWQVLAERVAQYREAGRAALPTDVAVALGRLERAAIPDDLSRYRLPIADCPHGLDEVLAAWRDTPVTPATLKPLSRPGTSWPTPELTGDEPGGLDLLGVTSVWTAPFRPERDDVVWALALLPNHPSRGAAVQLQQLQRGAPVLDPFLALAEVADPFGPVLAFTALVLAGQSSLREREGLAAALLAAWEEGRLGPDDLTVAWSSPWRDGWPLSAPKITPMLLGIAEAEGLALVWPLLAAMAEEIAARSKIPGTAATILEAVLALLPEVPGPVELPAITALADRRGTSKAVTLARGIAAALKRR
ncbi:hypothetical protein EII34_09560 [Arachnia propionica]|uniref:DUF7824 domain-containing protein n=1 Tax=Arachnia propionica TaxID=1750 RepID=A0A3P1T5R6_9ACTN|nr:hypothetical protein [Arachnia propionica]RRD04545.1 hypothetical protein EII34_09560 [Arachnia propionica]